MYRFFIGGILFWAIISSVSLYFFKDLTWLEQAICAILFIFILALTSKISKNKPSIDYQENYRCSHREKEVVLFCYDCGLELYSGSVAPITVKVKQKVKAGKC